MTGRTRLTAEQRRETILTAATAVFAECGYQRAKASEIAARVGVSEPVVFQNFGSKAGLFAAVIERASGTADELLTSFAGRPITEVLRALLSPEHLDALHAPGSLGVLFSEGTASDADPRVHQAAAAAVRRLARSFTAMLQRGKDAGELNADLDVEAFAWSLMSFVAARGFRRGVVDDPALEKRLIEQLLHTLG